MGSVGLMHTSVATTMAAAAAVAAVPATAATTTVPSHLGKARRNILFSLMENRDEISRLLGVYCRC